jgi:DNA-binding XRE family transcriptional regulator
MPATKPIEELRAKAAALIIARVSKTSVSKVKSDLGISRQAVYDILKGKYCPSLAVIQRACAEWNEEFNIRGLRIDQHTLTGKKKPTVRPVQTRLFEALELLENRRFQVKTRQTKGTIELVFRLKLSA